MIYSQLALWMVIAVVPGGLLLLPYALHRASQREQASEKKTRLAHN